MKTTMSLKHTQGMAFETELNGHKLIVDADESVGGQNLGPRPKVLLLVSLAGCTGMDVVSILKKMRIEFSNFEVLVEAEIAEEHPKKYLNLKVIYQIQGNQLPLDKIQQAVKLSEEKYCGVRASLEGGIPIESEIRIL